MARLVDCLAALALATPATPFQAIRVSVDSFGGQANGASFCPSVSQDGRYVAFASAASNLVSQDTNSVADVFVRDVALGVTHRVSVTSAGLQADGSSVADPMGNPKTLSSISISADGRRVAFVTWAPNLGASFAPPQIVAHDLAAGETELVTANVGGVAGNGGAYSLALSGNGRYVAFVSYSSDLIAGDTNGVADVFVRDLVANTTVRVIEPPTPPAVVYGGVGTPSISADGRWVVCEIYVSVTGSSSSTDVWAADRDSDGNGIFDEPSGTSLVRLTQAAANEYLFNPTMSASGRYVVYERSASPYELFLRDRDTDANGVFDEPGAVSTLAVGVVVDSPTGFGLRTVDVDAAGAFVASASASDGSTTWVNEQVLAREVATGTVSVASFSSTDGTVANANLSSGRIEISDDGNFLVCDSLATNLVPGDTNGVADIYLLPRPNVNCIGSYTYCIGAPNSVGFGARIGWSGSISIASNSFVLTSVGCPPGTTGLFFYGPVSAQVPFGNGYRCVGAGAIGVFRLGATTANSAGAFTDGVDFTQPPAGSGPGTITPGSGWNFQLWYRNPAGGGAGFNLSDALHVTFCP